MLRKGGVDEAQADLKGKVVCVIGGKTKEVGRRAEGEKVCRPNTLFRRPCQ